MGLAIYRTAVAYFKERRQQATFRAGSKWIRVLQERDNFNVVLEVQRKGRVEIVFTAFKMLIREVNFIYI